MAIGTKGEKLDKYLAFPFGVGVALVLDESALLLELDDVYWTEEGVLSVQIAFAAIAMLSAMAYLIRMLRTSSEAGLRDRLGARRQGLGRPADELRRRAGHRAVRTKGLARWRRRSVTTFRGPAGHCAPGSPARPKNRPQTEPWEDAVTIRCPSSTLFAVFWDGWLHNNSTSSTASGRRPTSRCTSGSRALGGWIGLVFVKRQPRGRKLNLSMEAVPYGYGLALVALPLAALGGPGDFAWHAAYGFENQVDAPFSPTHQMLFLAGGLLGGDRPGLDVAPARARRSA